MTAAQAQLANAKAQLATARKQLDKATVRSPMSGIVAERPANRGDIVSTGDPLYKIIAPSSMQLNASVPAEALAAIRVGLPVDFTVRGYETPFEGRIERISPTADPVTRQVSIYVSIPNKGGRLVAGLFAEGRVARQTKKALVVPATAVNTSSQGAVGDAHQGRQGREGDGQRSACATIRPSASRSRAACRRAISCWSARRRASRLARP